MVHPDQVQSIRDCSADCTPKPRPGGTPGETGVSPVRSGRLLIAHRCPLLSPDEYPFTQDLPAPILGALPFPKILHPNDINVNASILSFYTRAIVPRITKQATLALAAIKRANGIRGDAEYEDDGNYGSAATIDVEVLAAISKRVHYGAHSPVAASSGLSSADGCVNGRRGPSGKFVSESKFSAHPSAFIPHIRNPDRGKLEALITKPEVEARLLQRLRKKAAMYAQEFAPDGEPLGEGAGVGKIDVDGVVELYENYIIPLTKEIEVGCLRSPRGSGLK
jgi:chorismate mutase